jgi:hypothetical protein
MDQLPRHPHLYEINTRVWLNSRSDQYGRKLTLSSIPQENWDRLKDLGMDLVWLMGIWRPSPAGIAVDRSNPGLLKTCREILPDFTPADLAGSPYAVAGYTLNPVLGAESDLMRLRENLRRAGLGLILDFVPNHTAMDHPWVSARPSRYVSSPSASVFGPGEAFSVLAADGNTYWVAHGRDPYFAPWPDTAQLCSGCRETRDALAAELLNIAGFCDGLRVDMAMLPLNRVFAQTWLAWMGQTGISLPDQDYWVGVLEPLKAAYPDFILMAEGYWGLEADLLERRFDYVYDKAGYDRLRALDAPAYTQGLRDEGLRRPRMVRFLENHDEDRAAAAFSDEARRAAAVIHATAPGLRLFHHGQLEGSRIKLPVQLGRGFDEPSDPDFAAFYLKLLNLTRQPLFKEGVCQVLPIQPPVSGDEAHRALVAFAYAFGDQRGVVAVNLGGQVASGFLQFPGGFWQGWEQVLLRDEMSDPVAIYARDRSQIETQGLYVLLKPYGFHFFLAPPGG